MADLLTNLNVINVNALVTQIITTEKVPQDNLKATLSSQKSDLSTFQSLNTRLKALQSSAEDMIGSVLVTTPSW